MILPLVALLLTLLDTLRKVIIALALGSQKQTQCVREQEIQVTANTTLANILCYTRHFTITPLKSPQASSRTRHRRDRFLGHPLMPASRYIYSSLVIHYLQEDTPYQALTSCILLGLHLIASEPGGYYRG
jgi:hypothetical protein